MSRRAYVLSLYCRISADVGADFVKVVWNGSVEASAPWWIVVTHRSSSPAVPAVMTLRLAHDSIAAGAAGVMFGRRVFRADGPAAILDGLRAIVHEGLSVEQVAARF